MMNRMTITFNFDGGGSHKGSAAGWGWVCYASTADGRTHEYYSGCGAMPPGTTNNEAEYEALRMAVEYAIVHAWDDRGIEPSDFVFKGDSRLVIEQVKGLWQVKAEHLKERQWLLQRDLGLLSEPYSLQWVPREQNQRADELSRLGRAQWKRK